MKISQWTKKDLAERRVNGKETVISLFIGDHDHLATDNTTGEWWFAICPVVDGVRGCPTKDTVVFRGPYRSRHGAQKAWEMAHPTSVR